MATVGFGDFEWDEDKARSNVQNHGVSFEAPAPFSSTSDKHHFAFSPDGTKIRANQGHSVELEWTGLPAPSPRITPTNNRE
jgi:RNA:NAD 2'-phosphotransferase (TPT1/KptA family)